MHTSKQFPAIKNMFLPGSLLLDRIHQPTKPPPHQPSSQASNQGHWHRVDQLLHRSSLVGRSGAVDAEFATGDLWWVVFKM